MVSMFPKRLTIPSGSTPTTSTKLSIVLDSNVAVSVSTSRYRSAALTKLWHADNFVKYRC